MNDLVLYKDLWSGIYTLVSAECGKVAEFSDVQEDEDGVACVTLSSGTIIHDIQIIEIGDGYYEQ